MNAKVREKELDAEFAKRIAMMSDDDEDDSLKAELPRSKQVAK